jgi:hypothetical protein
MWTVLVDENVNGRRSKHREGKDEAALWRTK